MTIAYDNLDWVEGGVNLPGIRPVLYYIPKAHLASFPAMGADGVTYSGNFTLVDTNKFKTINCIDIKSPVSSEGQGEVRCKSFLNKATIVIALTEEKATAFAKKANNDDLVYVVQTKEGKYRVLGNEMFSTNTTVKQNLGGAPTDEKGTTIEIEVTDASPAPFYTGEIVTDAGTVNPGV